jgi:hypothetical protein
VLTLAIDPGNTESGWCVIGLDRRPLAFGKDANAAVLHHCYGYGYAERYDRVAIEMVASYGMAVGREVFETCVWIGRYYEALLDGIGDGAPDLIYRRDIKLHHCRSVKAKDSNIRQALVDRFAPGQPNHGKGTKAEPGWFYGFHSDVWQAFALAVYVADLAEGVVP